MPVATASSSRGPARKFSRNPIAAFYQSSIGKKVIVAITAIPLVLYVFAHLGGNLLLYFGQNAINTYAQFLRDLGPLLWVARIVLIAALVMHLTATIQLVIENRQAKPQKYAVAGFQTSTWASRTMIVTGLIVLCFVIYHLLHFTFMTTHPEFRELHDAQGRHDTYRMVILGFQQPLVSAFYLLSMFLLFAHLSHGLASLSQTLGINNRKLFAGISTTGRFLAWVVFVGFASIPVAVLLGIVS
jgi:succinate dehydrogenase cytochrome b subunit